MTGQLPITVTADDLRAAPWRFTVHMNMGGRGGYTGYQSAAFPEAAVFRGQEKVKGAWRGLHVIEIRDEAGEAKEFAIKHLDLAAAEISRLRQLRADAAAWDAADPSRKTA